MGSDFTSNGGEIKPYDFRLDGVAFVTSGAVATLDVSELAKLAEADIESVEGMAAISSIFRSALSAADYARFKAHNREHNTHPETLFAIMREMMEHFGQGNSRPPSTSSDGRRTTSGMSGASSRSAWPPPAPTGRQFTDEEQARIRAAVGRMGTTIDGQVVSGA